MSENFLVKTIDSVYEVKKTVWNKCANFSNDTRLIGNPFLSFEFFSALEDSGSVGSKTGWIPYHLILEKNHKIY